MKFEKSEKKPGTGTGKNIIGFWKGELKYINPTKGALQDLYKIEGDMEEPVYQGKDKNDKDWSLLRFIFEEELKKEPVEFKVFLSKEVSEWEKDGLKKSEYINQWGETQIVADKADLFKSFTHIQKWDDTEKKFVDVLDNGEPVEKKWRKAYKGESNLYTMLRRLVNVNWFEATQETDLFIKIDDLMRGKVSEISSMIGTDSIQAVVGMVEVTAKDGDNTINYYSNCLGSAWMPGYKLPMANIATQSNSWSSYDDKANSKGKNRDIYQFYQACKRSKNMIEFSYLHDFSPENHLAAGNSTIAHSSDSAVSDTDY